MRAAKTASVPGWVVRAPTLAQAVAHGPAWASRGATAILAPPPWRADVHVDARIPLDADRAQDSGNDAGQALAQAAASLQRNGLQCLLELRPDRVHRQAAATTAEPGWLAELPHEPALDPRQPSEAIHTRALRPAPPAAFVESWARRLRGWAEAGVSGLCFGGLEGLAPETWHALLTALHRDRPALSCGAWTPGSSAQCVAQRKDAGFDWAVSSLAWWDGRADWLAEEDARLHALGPVLAYGGAPTDARWLWAAALSGDGVLVEAPAMTHETVATAAHWRSAHKPGGPVQAVSGHGGRATAMLRRTGDGATALLALAPRDEDTALIDWSDVAALLPPGTPERVDGGPKDGGLEPDASDARAQQVAGSALWHWPGAAPILSELAAAGPGPELPRGQPVARISIQDLQPSVDHGRWPAKRIAHETVAAQATVFVDGHEHLAVDLCWRPGDDAEWRRVPMASLGNDRWQAGFRPRRVGPHRWCVLAWIDTWAGFCHEWQAKFQAGQALELSLQEGAVWLAHILGLQGSAEQPAEHWRPAREALTALENAVASGMDETTLQRLLDPALAALLRDPGERPFACASPPLPLWVDRARAAYGGWYELFPRSQSAVPGQHGRFDDVIARLPDIRRMGFDVLYLPPIHPIGRQQRKGRNNTLDAGPDDVGSPYAIGAAEGGHDAVHPALGTLADFERLVRAAGEHGLELALDFAIQCSPDHPWLRQHPDWFSWRPDGSLRHAENPPKRYEDIVNLSFYDAQPPWRRKLALWKALRDIVLFWAGRGVRIFRVDNPHTKPLPFWHWLIRELRTRAPDVVFLSEAFTRPAMMYGLAKLGFTQSYTYFTWRSHADELDAYFHELSRPPVADFFRPNFFTNTPDINPVWLQTHGRPGFLARAALAATGAGLWGVYSGFELCESAPLPGREEYLDSEKYELRQRDWFASGHIRDEIARLNAIRRANPALQSHRGYRRCRAEPAHVLAYERSTEAGTNTVLVIVNLDPQQATDARVWPESGGSGEDLLAQRQAEWPDGVLHLRLQPEAPYSVWRLAASGQAN